MKDSIIVYASTFEASKKLNKEQFVKFWTNYFDYGLNDKPFETDDVALDILFTATKPNIDNAIKRYNNCVENGKKGGRPKNQSNNQKENQEITKEKPRNNQEETKVEKSVNLNDNDNVDVNDTGNEYDNLNVEEKEDVYDDNTTSTCNDNNDFENSFEENEKTFCDTGVTVPTETRMNDDEYQSWCWKCIDKFKSGIGLGIVPSVQQILGYMLDNEVGYYKSFLESYPIGNSGNREIPSDDMNNHLYQLIQPMIQTYGYSIYADDEVLGKFNRWFIKSRLGESFEIEII